MKQVTGMKDVEFIIQNKLDVKDRAGKVIPFVRFLNWQLIQIIYSIQEGDLFYDASPY